MTTPWELIGGEKLLEAMENNNSLEKALLEEDRKGHHRHDEGCECEDHHHHDEGCGCEDHHHHDEACECGEHHHHDEKCDCGHDHHHADEVFTSWGLETVRHFNQKELKIILEKLSTTDEYGTILRAKGILQDEANNWFCFDLVPGEYEVREEAADYTGRLCVIGTQLNEERLKEVFGTC